jgi:hypothetical protein
MMLRVPTTDMLRLPMFCTHQLLMVAWPLFNGYSLQYVLINVTRYYKMLLERNLHQPNLGCCMEGAPILASGS